MRILQTRKFPQRNLMDEVEKEPEVSVYDTKKGITHAIKSNSINIIFGKRGTGKTTLALEILLRNYAKFERVKVLCSKFYAQHLYENVLPEDCIHSNPTTAQLHALFEEQTKNNIPTIWLMDDVLSNLYRECNTICHAIACLGRHYGLTVLISTQYLHRVSRFFTGNADTLWITKIIKHYIDPVFDIQPSGRFRNPSELVNFLESVCHDYRYVRFNLTANMDTSPIVFRSITSLELQRSNLYLKTLGL